MVSWNSLTSTDLEMVLSRQYLWRHVCRHRQVSKHLLILHHEWVEVLLSKFTARSNLLILILLWQRWTSSWIDIVINRWSLIIIGATWMRQMVEVRWRSVGIDGSAKVEWCLPTLVEGRVLLLALALLLNWALQAPKDVISVLVWLHFAAIL